MGLRFGIWGLGFGVWGLEFGVRGLGSGVWGLGFGATVVSLFLYLPRFRYVYIYRGFVTFTQVSGLGLRVPRPQTPWRAECGFLPGLALPGLGFQN